MYKRKLLGVKRLGERHHNLSGAVSALNNQLFLLGFKIFIDGPNGLPFSVHKGGCQSKYTSQYP